MEDLKAAVEERLQNGDSQLLLVAVARSIDSGQSQAVSSLFLQHRDVVKALGWDLLSLLTPHLPPNLPPSPSSPIWQLITLISETCSAKEMCLAFLEQLEAVSPSPPLFFHLLTPLLTVLVRLGVGDGRRHLSTLRSVRSLTARVYPSLEEEEEEEGFSPLTAARLVVSLVGPFTAHIHHQFTSQMAPLQTYWSPLQRETACLLLVLLAQPLVSRNLSRHGSEGRTTAETIMLTFPWWAWPVFVYLVLVEGVESSYLPSPLHPHHLLHTSLTHTLTLLHRQERHSVLKGLSLLETVVKRVETDSLPRHLLSHSRYLDTAKSLVDIMVTCPHKTLRQRSLSLLPSLVQRFTSPGRHTMYRCLLRECGHAGVQGMLIHCLKNEVDRALLSGEVLHPFLGPEFIPLVMGGLNFLRFLLIRDKPDSNMTGVWSLVDEVRSKFTSPVRLSLERNKVHIRGGGGKGGEGPEVTVEVAGEEVPEINPEEQARMLQLAEHQLDMLECVLVRVEELLEHKS
ncbi:Glomulin [Geodia barretti]|uniref:Glomulin n=1 Tax=Geodia barretti TaxID=519541 RepID=A0AA35WYN7_GEOBA|nr:Glomulin [Geodia barretti]